MELNFSFKKTKEQQPEKYPNVAVLTYLGSNKFALNNSAVRLLEYSEDKVTGRISFGATSTNKFFIANTSNGETANQSNLHKDNTFTNGKFVERFNKFFDINVEVGNEFVLATVDMKLEFPILIVENISPNSMTVDNFEQFPDDAFEEVGKDEACVNYENL